MSNRLQRFAMVGLLATVVDVAGFVVLYKAGWPLVWAELLVLNAAALVAWTLHRSVTLSDDPFVRWIGSPTVFGVMVVTAGLVDLMTMMILSPQRTWSAALFAKTVAVAAAALVRAAAYRMVVFRIIRNEQDHPTNRPTPPGRYRLSVVIPAYREADRIGQTIERVRSELGTKIDDLEIVVVDDGSGDRTPQAAASADQIVVLEKNLGKGGALRAGVAAAQGRTIAFTDADLAYAPAQIVDLLAQIENGHDWVVGSRQHAETRTVVETGWMRQAGGRLVNLATHVLLLGQYRDTQCGLKAFRSDVAQALFASSTLNGFAFDIELFHLAERWRLSLAEVPVAVEHSERTTVRAARDGLRLLRDISLVRRQARQGHYPADPGLPLGSDHHA
ncbi:MAG TPA: glycosyltransferase [Acidimicrobiia bacterium]|jgi:putative flippase GtrA|nr:glycosyltransferase [Acidimicrobiia bacterium]